MAKKHYWNRISAFLILTFLGSIGFVSGNWDDSAGYLCATRTLSYLSCKSKMLSLFSSYGEYVTSSIMLCVGASGDLTTEEVGDIIEFFHKNWPGDEISYFVKVLASARAGGLEGIWKVLRFLKNEEWKKFIGNTNFASTFDTYNQILNIANYGDYKQDLFVYQEIWMMKKNDRDERGNIAFGCKFPIVLETIRFANRRSRKTYEDIKILYETVCVIDAGWNWPQSLTFLPDAYNVREMLSASTEVVTTLLGLEYMRITFETVNDDHCRKTGWTVQSLLYEVFKCNTEYNIPNKECYELAIDAIHYSCSEITPMSFRSVMSQAKNKGYNILTTFKVLSAVNSSYFNVVPQNAPRRIDSEVRELYLAVYDYYASAVSMTGKKRPSQIQQVFPATFYGEWAVREMIEFFNELNISKFPTDLIMSFFDMFSFTYESMRYEKVMKVLKVSKAVDHNMPFTKIMREKHFYRLHEMDDILKKQLARKALKFYFTQTNISPCHADIIGLVIDFDAVLGDKLTRKDYETIFRGVCGQFCIPENNFVRWVLSTAITKGWDLAALKSRLETREGHLDYW